MARRRRRRKRFIRPPSFKVNSKIIWISSGVLFLILALGFLIKLTYTADTFKISKASIISNVALPASVYSKIEGESLFSLKAKDIRRRILKEHSEYKDVSVSKVFPATVVISAAERVPRAQVKGKGFYVVDRSGVVLSEPARLPDSELVLIELAQRRFNHNKGERIEAQGLDLALGLIDALANEGLTEKLKVKSINSSQPEAMYFLVHRSCLSGIEESPAHEIKITVGRDDLTKKLRVLENLIDRELGDKASLVEYIDLRHKKVYIGFDR